MGMRRAVSIASTVLVLMCILLILVAAPVGAQDSGGIPPGTAANGVDTDDNNSPPDVVLVAADACTVSPGASITLEDGDGTQARFVDGELEVSISEQDGSPKIEGPVSDFIGDHATFPDADTAFDTDGDYSVVASSGITCEVAGRANDDGTPAGDQYTNKPPGPVDNPKGVMPGTGAKKVPNTGGPPIVLGALVLLGAALIAGRGILKR
jgi:hypothetical protein